MNSELHYYYTIGVVTKQGFGQDKNCNLRNQLLSFFRTFSQYNKDQMYSVKLDGQDDKCLITQHNNLEGNTFHDPNPGKSFRFDHLKKVVSELKDHSVPAPPLRRVLDEKLRAMVARQYGKEASCGVFYKVGYTWLHSNDDVVAFPHGRPWLTSQACCWATFLFKPGLFLTVFRLWRIVDLPEILGFWRFCLEFLVKS